MTADSQPPLTRTAPGNEPKPDRRSWRWYVEDSIENDPVDLVQSLGLTVAKQHTFKRRLYKQIYRELLSDELTRLHETLNVPPSPRDMQIYGDYPPAEYIERYGSWSTALRAAAIQPPDNNTSNLRQSRPRAVVLSKLSPRRTDTVTEPELVATLRDFAVTIQAPPKPIDISKFTPYTAQDYISEFGSWHTALQKAGIPNSSKPTPDSTRVEFDYQPFPREESQTGHRGALLDELRSLATRIGTQPSPRDMQQFGQFSRHDYTEVFGSWENALCEAGLTNSTTSNAPPWHPQTYLSRIKQTFASLRQLLGST